jgi:hypothetical protein
VPLLRPGGEPVLEGPPGAAFDHVQQACRAGAAPHRGQVDDHGDELVALAGVPPDVHAQHPHPVEPGRVADQHPTPLGQDGVVGGVPRHRKGLGDPGDGQVLADDGDERPPQRPAGQPGPGLGGATGVLTPDVPAAGAGVAADGDDQRGGPPRDLPSSMDPDARQGNDPPVPDPWATP